MHKDQKCDKHGRSCEADNINGVLEFSSCFLSGVCVWNSHEDLPSEPTVKEANAPSKFGFPLASQRHTDNRLPAEV